jgi:DNA-binding NarL/FixJ family response regulator
MIVDDNLIARATLKQISSQIADLNLVGECADAIEAYNQLQTVPVDL